MAGCKEMRTEGRKKGKGKRREKKRNGDQNRFFFKSVRMFFSYAQWSFFNI